MVAGTSSNNNVQFNVIIVDEHTGYIRQLIG